ncbi:MAG: UDP-3-O-(3-hydroxymyristoyl)glucosamine N-acyltransferase [Bacteroidetes bacterium]|jgi:UDP-3-O-[3-hydroxymyristoyl] glucosamine N-acyltransferase|nr:UDP-3-O-(3-hydroxymyristoyl)glucosamine N-acyltransferase [Bacteroidota bacterium]MBT6687881.1 UDP-3-O-(3-hydroxymyristoyl)glucosamine N-acyltransferase [Bacteroidota bacterium]MBT7142471.1 UDP-3-O-(3-hydroxymyristoyl)glucosamine N-acyltransferase [Bacteroidota bacterium]MBT7490022.1 UDP-3-O-(3-hydroxymyristoyl)glucosamine N-acyltransferase [Bacteroidota bacterium]
MEFTANYLAQILKGNVEGDGNVTVSDFSRIEDGKTGTLSFLANPKYNKYLYTTESNIVIINKDFEIEKEVSPTLIRVENAYESFAELLTIYESLKKNQQGIEQPSFISQDIEIPDNVYVGAFTYIGQNVKIGNNVKIYPNCYIADNVEIKENTIINSGVRIYSECKIGSDCTFHSGVVIGSDGFGFAPQKNNDYKKVPQIGNVIIEDNVEVGANTTIDRATIGSTIIRKGVKLDNLIQIGHNVEIGENTVIAAQSGIAGSTKIGKACMIGGQVGIIGHLTIADEVKIAAQSGIAKSIKEKGAIYQGSPAFKIIDYQKSLVIFKNLPQLKKQIDTIEKSL